MATFRQFLAGLVILAAVFASSHANKKTLVLLDNWSIRETHSVFFKSLRGKMTLLNDLHFLV